jgi:hypothetical protein
MKKSMLLGALLLCAACASKPNPQMQSATDQLLASARGGHAEDAPSSYEPMPWAEGQWILLRNHTGEGKAPSVTRMSIVRKEGDGFWVQTETQDYQHRTLIQMLYARQPLNTQEAGDAIVKMIVKQDDRDPVTYEQGNPAMSMARAMLRNNTVSLVVPENVASLPRESVNVAAGSFAGTISAPVSVSVGPFTKRFTSWYHPAVPINGAVKSTSEDGSLASELLDYGTTGAQSAL